MGEPYELQRVPVLGLQRHGEQATASGFVEMPGRKHHDSEVVPGIGIGRVALDLFAVGGVRRAFWLLRQPGAEYGSRVLHLPAARVGEDDEFLRKAAFRAYDHRPKSALHSLVKPLRGEHHDAEVVPGIAEMLV